LYSAARLRREIVTNSRKNRDKKDLVLTPGGLRPRHLVHEVGADEVVRFDKDGKVSVIRKGEHESGEGKKE